MKYVLKNIASFILLAALALSCTKNLNSETGGNEITFTTQLADMAQSKASEPTAGRFTDSNLNSLGKFLVIGYDGTSKVINARDVFRTDDEWKFNDNPVVWYEGHAMTFYASANMPSWARLSSNSSASAQLTVDSVPSSAADQFDPLIGYYSGTGVSGRADLVFHHAFTGVTFVTGDKGTPQFVAGIKSVKINGVHSAGTATITAEGSDYSCSWSTDGTKSVTGAFISDGSKSEKPFLLIPQNLAEDILTFDITVDLSAGGTQVMKAALVSGSLEPGYCYTYTLDFNPDAMSPVSVSLTKWEKLSGYFNANFE